MLSQKKDFWQGLMLMLEALFKKDALNKKRWRVTKNVSRNCVK